MLRLNPWIRVLSPLLLVVAAGAAVKLATRSVNESSARPLVPFRQAAETGASADEANAEGLDWDQPFADSLPVAALNDAARRLRFRPVVPPLLGPPRSIFVHRSLRTSENQAVALVYQSARFGRFFVLESPTRTTPAKLEAIPSHCRPERGCVGTWTMMTLDDGTRALLVAGPVSTVVVWLRGDVRFDLAGPADTFTAADAKLVAGVFARGA
jgi:hypothetical protein